MKFVKPTYSREARLAHTEGIAKLKILISDDNSIAEIQPVSGDPLLLDSSITAVRQWCIYSSLAKVVGKPVEIEIPISFVFAIEDAPKPAYLHLVSGRVIGVDEVREFTNGIEYTIDQRTHHISTDSVTDVNGCARIVLRPPQRQGECLPSGEPSFDITAIPLLPSDI